MKAEFDQFAQTYREQQTEGHSFLTGEDSHYFARLKAEKLKEWLPQYFASTPRNILDFGCGDGLMTEEVRLQFPNSAIHGVDNSEESIKIARKNHPEVQYHLSTDNLSMFPSNTFDVLMATHVFHHIPFQEHEHYIRELVRVLRKDGILVFFELNPLNPGTWYIFRNHPMEVNAKMLTPRYSKKLLKPHGAISFKSYAFFPHALKILRPLERFLTKIPFGGLYAVILKKS